ncbi:MAG: HupE/UreJ family protein [Pseudomonadota bacterium]|nr:HupE/UreJ family protein [Pseudomonadota bacterium]
MTRFFALAAAMILTTTSAALAHHPLGGMTPTSFTEGFLSGIGHPVIGFDHLAFVIAVGLITAFHRNRVLMPAAFVAGTVGGAALTLAAVTLPLAELVITGSVIIGGAVAMRGRVTDLRLAGGLAAGAGLFHGWAYGATIVGAEPTPILAYLVGFGLVQMAIAIGVAALVHNVWKALDAQSLQPRLAGALVAGVGVTYMVEIVEAVMFPAM